MFLNSKTKTREIQKRTPRRTKSVERTRNEKKRGERENAPHALFAHRSWTTIRRDAASRFFGDATASAFAALMIKKEIQKHPQYF